MKKYTMCVMMDKDSSSPRFVFEAKDDKEADDTRLSWARYHSMSREDVIVRESKGSELNWEIHNEYVWDLI